MAARRGATTVGGTDPAWLGRVRRALVPWRDRGVVVAVSGGGDSVGLLRIMHVLSGELDLRLSVAHLHHGIRAVEADADAAFVAGLAEALDLPCDVGRWRTERPGHIEADARRARYTWLAGVAHARGASAVAVGHTRDDQAETILHRVLRGTGPRGLAGMPRARPLAEGIRLIRPLLGIGRAEVRGYLEALGQPWREDATNADPRRTRAWLRHDLLPKLAAEANPRVVEALVRLGRLAGAEHALVRHWTERDARASRLDGESGTLELRLPPLRAAPLAYRAEVLRAAWRMAGWPERGMSAARWRRLARLAGQTDGRLDVGAGIVAVVRDDRIRLTADPAADRPILPEAAALPVPGTVGWGGGIRLSAVLDPDPATPCDEVIDWDRVEPFGLPDAPSLLVRAPEPGDRFAPLGLGGHTTPLADFLRGRRVPSAERPGIPLVCDRLGIVWVAGHRIAERVRRAPETRRRLGLRRDREG
jgi:tRNA(Ile)-lysidine synthase